MGSPFLCGQTALREPQGWGPGREPHNGTQVCRHLCVCSLTRRCDVVVLKFLFKLPSFFSFLFLTKTLLILLLSCPPTLHAPFFVLLLSSHPPFWALFCFLFLSFFKFYFYFPPHSRQPFLDHQVFIYVNNCRPAPCGGQPAMTSVHLPSLHPTSPTPGNPLTPSPPPPGLSAREQRAGQPPSRRRRGLPGPSSPARGGFCRHRQLGSAVLAFFDFCLHLPSVCYMLLVMGVCCELICLGIPARDRTPKWKAGVVGGGGCLDRRRRAQSPGAGCIS